MTHLSGIVGNGIREAPEGVHSPLQNIVDAVADLLPGEMGGDDGGDVVFIGS